MLRLPLLLSIMIVLLLLSPACREEGESAATPGSPQSIDSERQTSKPPQQTGERTAKEAALDAAEGKRLGGVVTVVGAWDGVEQEAFLEMVKPFQRATQISVIYEGDRDLSGALLHRIRQGEPPHLVSFTGPGQMAEFARQGMLVDLGPIVESVGYVEQYNSEWIRLGTVGDQINGVFVRINVKGLIWYNPATWQARNLEVPESWKELMALSRHLAEDGDAPWCLGLESGAASGWPGTDWIESIVLQQSGPEVYDRWHRGELAWTSSEIRKAWETWGLIAGNAREMVYGGRLVMLDTNFGNAGDPLFRSPPGCYMLHQGSFITDFLLSNNPDAEAGKSLNFFPLPPFEPTAPKRVTVVGDLFGMFVDTPQSRALLRYLVTPEAQAIWVKHGGAISPNQKVSLEHYPDELSRRIAEQLRSTETVRFDASDLMPREMNSAFMRAIVQYTEDPEQLDLLLEELEVVRKAVFP